VDKQGGRSGAAEDGMREDENEKVVAPDGRLRLKRKFRVEIPTREGWDGRSVTAREGVQTGTPTLLGGNVPTRHKQGGIFLAGGVDEHLSGRIVCNPRGCHKQRSYRRTRGSDRDLLRQSGCPKGILQCQDGQQTDSGMLRCPEQSGKAEAGKPSVYSGTSGVRGILARLGSSESSISAEPHIVFSNRQVARYWSLEGTTETWRKAERFRQARELGIRTPSDAKATSKWLMSRSRWTLKTKQTFASIGIGDSLHNVERWRKHHITY